MSFLNTDIPELSGFDTGLCLSNLDILNLRQNRVNESTLAVLSELTDALIRDAEGDPDTVDSILLSLQSTPDTDEDDSTTNRVLSTAAPVNRELLRLLSRHAGLYARLILYRMLEEKMPSRKPDTEEKYPISPLPAMARERVAYMPGSFADKAYLRLTSLLKSPRANATTSFVDACEEVHSGLCEYCILPLENTHSGRLTAFTRLILRYRLQIVAVCDLENGAAAGQSTRFALLREAEEGRFPVPLTVNPPLCLELVHLTASPSLTDLLIAAEFCGMTPCRIDTLPRFDELENFEESSDAAFACVWNAADGDLSTFRRFLSLETPETVLTGIYGTV